MIKKRGPFIGAHLFVQHSVYKSATNEFAEIRDSKQFLPCKVDLKIEAS